MKCAQCGQEFPNAGTIAGHYLIAKHPKMTQEQKRVYWRERHRIYRRTPNQLRKRFEYQKKYRETHRETIRQHNRKWRKQNKAVLSRKAHIRYETLKEYNAEAMRFHRMLVKLQVLQHYSNGVMKCACCGENCVMFLSVDHEHGGGYKHRKQVGGGLKFYKWLIKNNYPEGYQVLCFNCNLGKSVNNSVCPHKVILRPLERALKELERIGDIGKTA